MSLKHGPKILVGFICLLAGAAISYIASQHQYFDIKTEFNVIEALISTATIGIGLYIAIILEKSKNRGQNFYNYVEGKYDALWEDFIKFSEVLENSTNLPLSESSKWFKKIDQKLTPLIKVFESFEYDATCLTKIETKIESLEKLISENSHIENQIVDLSFDKDQIVTDLDEINELFAKSFKDLSSIH